MYDTTTYYNHVHIFFPIESISSINNRNGTCYSLTDCSNRGGSASGGCAAG